MEGVQFQQEGVNSGHEFDAPITPEEAQAVIDLWAERRKQAEVDANHPKAHDLAEALNVSNEQVLALLSEVRRRNQPQPAPVFVQASHPRTKIRLALAIVFLLIGITIMLTSMVKPAKVAVLDDIAPPVAIATDAPAIATATPAPYEAFNDNYSLPSGMKVTFDGVSLRDAPTFDAGSYGNNDLQNRLEQTLGRFVASRNDYPRGGQNIEVQTDLLVDALINEKPGFERYFIWRDATVTFNGISQTIKIPVNVHDSTTTDRLVDTERRRRIAILASRAVDLITERK